jgi:hypothetical protein
MKNISTLLIFLIVASCKYDNKIAADLSDIKKMEIIQCYSLEETFDAFLKLNDIIKNDSSRPKPSMSNDNELLRQMNTDSGVKDYPLFSVFKPYGYFDGQAMTYINSSFLGVINNSKKSLLLFQLADTEIKNGFPTNIYFFYIPSPYIDTMSVLIGAKTKDYKKIIRLEDVSAFGFQKIKSYDLKGNQVKESIDAKSFMPYLVFKETGKNLILSGEYLLKLTLRDTIVYKSLDRSDVKLDTIFFGTLFTRKKIKDNIE